MASWVFRVGQRVIFKPSGPQSGHWYEGRVTAVTGDADGARVYSIQKYDQLCDPTYEVPGSDEPLNTPGETVSVSYEYVQPLPRETSMSQLLADATWKGTPFDDPLETLYRPTREDIISHPLVQSHGMDLADGLAHVVANRRNIEGAPYSLHEIVESLEMDRDVESLKEDARKNYTSMLRLADLKRFELLGQRGATEGHGISELYTRAAWGIPLEDDLPPSEEFDIHYGYPLGPPEALCAQAWAHINALNHYYPTDGFLDILRSHMSEGVQCRMRTEPHVKHLIHMAVFLYGHAIRRQWACPDALNMGLALREAQVSDEFLPDSHFLSWAFDCQVAEREILTPQELSQLGFPPISFPTGQPTKSQLRMFKPKATEMFLSLPVQSDHLHVEYSQMKFPPYPLASMVVNPLSGHLCCSLLMEEELAYIPFSEVAFETIWTEFVFSLHIGDKKGGRRQRPALLTFPNRAGDRKFAAFIQNKIGVNCGTQIKVVQTDNYIIHNGRTSTKLSEIMSIFPDMLALVPMGHSSAPTDEDFVSPQQIACRFMPLAELKIETRKLKEEGDGLFVQNRFVAAQKAYTEAIDLIRSSSEMDSDVYELLGTLLSNRVACILETAESMSPNAAKHSIQHAIEDCGIALDASWKSHIPATVFQKLNRQRQDAETKLGIVTSQEMSSPNTQQLGSQEDEESPFNGNNENNSSQRDRPQGYRRHRRNNGSRRNRQRQRRRDRQRNTTAHEEAVDVLADALESSGITEAQESAEEVISFVFGKDLAGKTDMAFAIAKDDPCPCCIDRFGVELADTHAAVLSCGHSTCLPCLSGLHKKVAETRNASNGATVSFACPHCRFPVRDDAMSLAVEPILAQTNSLQSRVNSLPLNESDSVGVVESLLTQHNFVIRKVIRDLDAMLVDHMQFSVRKVNNWTPEEKQKIYEEARKPLDDLFSLFDDLQARLGALRDLECEEAISIGQQLQDLQEVQIPQAREKATKDIWAKMNSAGTMGGENEQGEVEVDFHALHVNEARKQFDLRVIPILKAVKTVVLVVGRGSHSEGNKSKLKPALQKHIDTHDQKAHLQYSGVHGNPGAIRVHWM